MTQATTPRRSSRAARTTGKTDRRHLGVLIIGSGFAGLGAAIRLRQGRPRRLPGHRAGQRGRRHLARQHLPRRGVRRPVPPVLVLLRAQPEVVAFVLAAAGDPGLPPLGRREVQRRRQAPLRDRGDARASGTTTRSAGWSTPRAATSAPMCWSAPSARCASRPCPTSRASRTSRASCSTPPAGTTTPTSRASGSRSSAPARRPSRSGRPSPARSATSTSTSARRRGSCRATTGRTRRSRAWPTSTCRSCSGPRARRSTGAARRSSSASPTSRRSCWPPSGWPRRTSPRASPIPSCGRRSRRTGRSAASAS